MASITDSFTGGDFLRSAKSVGNPGAKQDTYEVGWLFRKQRPKGAKYWTSDPEMDIDGTRLRRYQYFHGQPAYTRDIANGLVVQANGLWRYLAKYTDYSESVRDYKCRMGRNVEGLFGEFDDITSASQIDRLQQQLIVLMRENSIPLPS